MKVSEKAMLCLGNRIKKARKQAGLTQEQLAVMIGVTRSAVTRWETGDIEPGINNLIMLATILNVSADHLLGLAEQSEAEIHGMKYSPAVETALEALVETIQEKIKTNNTGRKENEPEQKKNFR